MVDTQGRTTQECTAEMVWFMERDGYAAQMHTLRVEPWVPEGTLYTMSGERA